MQTESVPELRFNAVKHSRAAHNLLAEKGSSTWTPADQARFDLHVDEAERARARLDAARLAGGARDQVSTMYRAGADIFLRKPPKEMTDHERRLVSNTMSTTTGSQGGFAVPALVASDFVSLLKGASWMRAVAKEITTDSGSDMNYAATDGTAEVGEVVGQNSTATALDPTFASVPINCTRFSSKLFTVPIELLRDSSIDVVELVFQRARDRIARISNQKFTTGTGTGEPTGLVTAASVGKTGTAGQTLTIIYDDLADMIDSVDDAFLGVPTADPNAPAAGWMFSSTMRKVVRKIKDTAGRPIWTPSYDDGVAEATRAMLLDYPVFLNSDMAVPAANAKTLAFVNGCQEALFSGCEGAVPVFGL